MVRIPSATRSRTNSTVWRNSCENISSMCSTDCVVSSIFAVFAAFVVCASCFPSPPLPPLPTQSVLTRIPGLPMVFVSPLLASVVDARQDPDRRGAGGLQARQEAQAERGCRQRASVPGESSPARGSVFAKPRRPWAPSPSP